MGINSAGEPTYTPSAPGQQSEPGLIIFRYDAELFYANANSFVDDVEKLIDSAPTPVKWLVLDASSLDPIDYSAGLALGGPIEFVQARKIRFALTRADLNLTATLDRYDLLERIGRPMIFGNLGDAVAAFHADQAPPRG